MISGSLPQLRYRSAAPSSEGALGGYHPYTYVLVYDPTIGRDIHPDLSHINPLLLVANFPAVCYDNSANSQKG